MATYTTTRRERQAAYRDYLRSFRWRVVRWVRKVLDLGACQDCLKRGRVRRYSLQVHHESYRNRGGSLAGEIMDTVTLCAKCHAKRHGKAVAND
jgi:5-methylcytosine-specific restriction endonuclease McrA